MNKTATNIVDDSFEKVAKFGKAKSTALEIYKNTAAKQGKKINPKVLKSVALGAGGIAGATAIDKAIKKHDEKKLKDDTKVRFRRDILMPGAKRTAKQMAVGAVPIAGAVLGATYLRHSPKKSGHVFSDMAKAQKYTQGQRVFNPEQARDLLKKSVKAGGAAYVGSKFYLRDKDLRDRAKVTGQEIKPSDRVMNALVPVARKKLPKSIKSTGIGSVLALSTPEVQIQLKRQKEESKNKMNKKAFDLVENSFEKIARLTQEEMKEFQSLAPKIESKQKSMMKKDKKDIDKDALGQIGGTAGAIGGTKLINSARREGQLDGIVRRYHNTKAENVAGIKEHGIKASKALDKDALTRITGLSEDQMKGKTYMAKNRMGARSVGARRQQIQDATNPFIMPNETESLLKSFKHQKTMKVNIPLDEYKKLNFVDNPELRGAKSYKDVIKKSLTGTGEIPADPLSAMSMYKTLGKETDTVAGDISSRFIKGGKGYKKQTLKGIGKHIKNNPKEFAKGLGKAGLGAGLLAGGAVIAGKSLKSSLDRNKRYKEELSKDPNYSRYNELSKKMWN